MTMEADVRAFHVRFDEPHPAGPTVQPPALRIARMARLREESGELDRALARGNLDEIANEAVDVIYIALGCLVAHGLSLEPFWNMVHKANMTKEKKGPDGKIVKPVGFVKPDFAAEVLRQAAASGIMDE